MSHFSQLLYCGLLCLGILLDQVAQSDHPWVYARPFMHDHCHTPALSLAILRVPPILGLPLTNLLPSGEYHGPLNHTTSTTCLSQPPNSSMPKQLLQCHPEVDMGKVGMKTRSPNCPQGFFWPCEGTENNLWGWEWKGHARLSHGPKQIDFVNKNYCLYSQLAPPYTPVGGVPYPLPKNDIWSQALKGTLYFTGLVLMSKRLCNNITIIKIQY